MRLREPELRCVVEFAGTIAEVDHFELVPRIVLGGLQQLLGGDLATYNQVDVARRQERMAVWPAGALELGPSLMSAYLQHMHQQPIVSHLLRCREPGPLRVCDVPPQSEFRRLDIYNDFYRHIEVEHQIGVAVDTKPGLIVGFGLHRTRREFADREIAVLKSLRPHLVALHRRLLASDELSRTVAALEQSGGHHGVVVVDGTQRVALVRGPVVSLVENVYGPLRPGHPLPKALTKWLRTAPTRRGAGERLQVDRQGARLELTAVRLQRQGGQWATLQGSQLGPEWAILVNESAVPSSGTRQARLSPREQDVLELVAAGLPDAEIAHHLYLSPRTVHKHLQNAFRKLGVSNRTAAARAYLDDDGRDCSVPVALSTTSLSAH